MNIFKKTFSLLLVLAILILPTVLFAQGMTPPPPTGGTTQIGVKIENPFNGGNDVMSLIRAILSQIVMPIAAVGVVVWIVWAGFQFVLAQGNTTKITAAKNNLLWSLVGAGLLLGAAGISLVVENTVRALIN